MKRWVIAAWLLLASTAIAASAQDAPAKPKDEDKVSNDQPDRPLQMPPASTEVKEALDDFDRFKRRSAWERALKALYTIPEDQASKFIDGENGFIIPVASKRRQLLAALAPAAQTAYRLFYDAEAQRLFKEAAGPNELKSLERIYSAYFTTSVGDNAADRLGDFYFELGHFDRAANCWLSVLRECPDTDLSRGLLGVKAGLALYRAGRRTELEQIRSELADRYSDERVSLGGQTAAPAALLGQLIESEKATVDAEQPARIAGPANLKLDTEIDADWQFKFAASVEAGMNEAELVQWESNALSAVVPSVTIDGSTLFANYLGYIIAIDTKSGKMLWRSGSFHHLEAMGNQNFAGMMDTSRFTILAAGDQIWTLGRDLKDQNFFAPFQLVCRRATSGEVVWQSHDLSDYAQLDLCGPPILAAGKLFIPAKGQGNQQNQGMPQQLVLAIQPHDGKVLWKSEIGSFRQNQMYNRWGWGGNMMTEAQPRLIYRVGAIYIETHAGVLARLDADSGALDWGYAYQTDPVQGQGRFFWNGYMQMPETPATGSAPLESGETLVVKGMQSTKLFALDPNRMKVAWERPVARSSRLLGTIGTNLIMGGDEICGLDLPNKTLQWATRVPNGCLSGRVLVRPDGLWQLTSRGIVELDPKSGEVRRIFRGKDLGTVGGDLILTDTLLLAVSNRTITAYPRRPAGPQASRGEDSNAKRLSSITGENEGIE
jgi:outer membrane protein assembly factor BamB